MRKFTRVLLAATLLSCLGVVLIISCGRGSDGSNPSLYSCQPDDPPSTLVGCIRNKDIQWDMDFGGYVPRLSGVTAALLDTKENIEPLLLDALLDKDRFVSAHVLLTFRAQIAFIERRGDWNGLKLDLLADGQVSYEGNNLTELYKQWEEALKQPKPDEK